jgi:hypothetical protein
MVKNKEDCQWCMNTQHIDRKIFGNMPDEYRFRCSGCHEEWAESHVECDMCMKLLCLDDYDTYAYGGDVSDRYLCVDCVKKR